MDVVNGWFRYRPIRIGWCISYNDFDSLRRAIKLSFCFWGGNYFPIIPIDDSSKADILIKKFKVDILYPLKENDKDILAFIENYNYLKSPFFQEGLFNSIGNLYPNFLDINFPSVQIINENFNKSVFKILKIDSTQDDPIKDIIDIEYGIYPDEKELRINYNKQIEKYFEVSEHKLSLEENIYSINKNSFTLSKLSTHNLNTDNFHYTNFKGYYCGSIESFDDLINYWNLKASNIKVKFYDKKYQNRFENYYNSFLSLRIVKTPGLRYDTIDYISFWYNDNLSLDFGDFNGYVKKIKLDSNFWNNYTQPQFYFAYSSKMGYKINETNKLSFQILDIPKIPNHVFSHFVIDYKLVDNYLPQKEVTYQIPYIPKLNIIIGSRIAIIGYNFRAGTEYCGIIYRIGDNNLTLFPLNLEELLNSIFGLFDLKISISKAGLITKRIIEQFKGLITCRIFKIEGVRDLISKFRPNDIFDKTNAIQKICRVEAQAVIKEKIEEFKKKHIKSPSDVFDEMLKLGIFRAGLDIKCPVCNLNFWRIIDDIKTHILCEYCTSEINLLLQLKDRNWFYRRSGIFGDDNNQEGAIPTILTIYSLSRTLGSGSNSSNYYYPSFEIENKSSKIINNSIEIDFVFINQIQNNCPNIIIGECKSKKEFDQNDIDNLVKVKEILETEDIKVFILISKLSDLSENELSILKSLNDNIKNRLIILTKDELECRKYLYEEKSKTFSIRESILTIEEMVRNTNIIYFNS